MPPGQAGHGVGKIAGKSGLRQRPGHGGCGADDEQDRTGQRRRLDQHRVNAPPVELPVDQQPGQHRIGDADGRDLGRGRDALDHGGANDERQGDGGQRDDEGAADLPRADALRNMRQIFAAIAPPHHDAKDRADHEPGSSPPVNSAAMDTPVTEPTVISTRLGGMVSVCAPVADNSATSSPGFEPRALISGNSAGAIAAMSAAFEPEIPDTRYMAPIST